jgi:flagellar L-ring protein precursor FlgH
MAGCSLVKPQLTPIDREVLRTPSTHTPVAPPPSEGSLFVGESRYSLLFVDRKARLVNDVITIRIIESASASGEATTATDRDSAVKGGIDSLFGIDTTNMNLQASLQNGFDGSGKTTRKNTLTGTITAVVREVFPNGNMYVEGAKEVIINNERQYIIISGIVRPEDINTDNSITSDRIANARIEYSGSGVLAEKQRPGWLSRVLDVIWPF